MTFFSTLGRKGMLAGLLLATTLTACGGKDERPPKPEALPPTADACGASALQDLVGQRRGALNTKLILQPVRIVNPGEAVSLEYDPARITVLLDRKGRITHIACN